MSLRIFIGTATKGEAGRFGYSATLKYGKAEKEVSGVITMANEKQAALAGVLAACQVLKRQVDMTLLFGNKDIADDVIKAIRDKTSPQNKNERDSKLWASLIGNSYHHNIEAEYAGEDSGDSKMANRTAMQALDDEDAASDNKVIEIFISIASADSSGTAGYASSVHDDGKIIDFNGCLADASDVCAELTGVLIALKGIEQGCRIRIHTESARLADELTKRIADGYTTHLNDGNKLWTEMDKTLPIYRIEVVHSTESSSELTRTANLAKGALDIMHYLGGDTSKLANESILCINS